MNTKHRIAMKKFITLCFSSLLFTTAVMAQNTDKHEGTGKKIREGVKEGAGAVKEAGKTVGHEVAEQSAKGYHAVKDEKYNNKVGPEGQTIYISGNDQYYYINEKGNKVYVTKDQLKDKN